MYSTAELIGLVQDAALRYGVDPNIAVVQLDLESVHFRPLYVYGPGKSPAGAMGIAQFMPGTWATYGNGSPYDPVAALDAWGRYMSHLLSIFGGRYDLALAGYNWGENRSSLRQALSSGQSVLTYSIPAETRNYVQTILSAAPVDVAPPPIGSSAVDDVPYLDSIPTPYALPPVGSSSNASSMLLIGVVVLAGFLVVDSISGR
jgi:hypothetical protein